MCLGAPEMCSSYARDVPELCQSVPELCLSYARVVPQLCLGVPWCIILSTDKLNRDQCVLEYWDWASMIINASDVVQVIHTTQVRDEERKFCIFVQPGPPLVGELHSHCLGCFLFVFLLLFTLRRSRAGWEKVLHFWAARGSGSEGS